MSGGSMERFCHRCWAADQARFALWDYPGALLPSAEEPDFVPRKRRSARRVETPNST